MHGPREADNRHQRQTQETHELYKRVLLCIKETAAREGDVVSCVGGVSSEPSSTVTTAKAATTSSNNSNNHHNSNVGSCSVNNSAIRNNSTRVNREGATAPVPGFDPNHPNIPCHDSNKKGVMKNISNFFSNFFVGAPERVNRTSSGLEGETNNGIDIDSEDDFTFSSELDDEVGYRL